MISLILAFALQAELSVPGFTAYLDPKPEALQMDEKRGFVGWTDPADVVVWYGKLAASGNVRVRVKIDGGTEGHNYEMTVYRQTRRAALKNGEADFGTFRVSNPGYQSFRLASMKGSKEALGVPTLLLLNGPGVAGAQFNLKSRRNAASVHLSYPIDNNPDITGYYCEVEPKSDPVHTFYMACGFKRGYFGIQVNSSTERRVIFSIWDAGSEANDRNKVNDENRVKLLAKGDGVVAGDFGNEGTGGHSHLVYNWKLGDTFRFFVTAKPERTATIYTSYFWFPDRKAWGLISSFRAPKDGGYLKGMHSFIENFWGTNGNVRRTAVFKNQWIRIGRDTWKELGHARFTCDATGKADRFDYLSKPDGAGFLLQNGGFEDNGVKLGDTFDRLLTGKAPVDLPVEK